MGLIEIGKPELSVRIADISMKNPVMVASGTFGYGKEYADFIDLASIGAIVAKSITLKPKLGNPPPRVCETPAGMLNAIGLQNVGLEKFITEKMPFLGEIGVPVIASISGEDIEDYVKLASRLNSVKGLSGIEINISCPNVSCGGMAFGGDASTTFNLVKSVRAVTELTIIAKLTPNVTDIVTIAKNAEEAGADALSLINTLLGMAIDIKTRKPKLANITGGLSGPAVRPVAVRMVWQVADAVNIPVIGMGGIMTAEDAVEFMIAGASAVAMGTANFVNPQAVSEVILGIEKFMIDNHIKSLQELTGSLKTL
ncbi:dihydroorotate dehydrogenase [Candidatus Poribacteria bacterium]|nr:dihydroorotate dehydrogenase [Candidatus Poribacteria bacterium]